MSTPGVTAPEPGPETPPASAPAPVSSPSPGPRRVGRVRDRDVVLAAAVAVAIVLGAQALGVIVPGFDDLLGLQPVVIGVLVLVTLAILVQAVRAGLDRR